jgi:hypothetical protein
VRHAAPATRDWSAAQACENRCIESDWRALAWALSGLRVLFTRPAIPLQTMDDVSLAAQKSLALHRKSANRSWLDRYLPLLSGLLSGLPLSAFFIHRSHGTARLGWVFIALFFILDLLVLRLSTPRRELPSRQDQHAAILFYRQSLGNSSNRASTHFWFPPFSFCLLFRWVFVMTMGVSYGDFLRYFAALICISVVTSQLRQQQRNRRRLAQIDAVLAAAKPASCSQRASPE